MRRSILLISLLVMACSSQSSNPAALHSTPATSSSSSTPATTSPAAPPIAELACRIPVMLSVTTGEIPGGWITFPGGSFQPDPSSNIPRNPSPELLSYDRAFNRWIEATWNHISPDGRRYATSTGNGLDMVDVGTGRHTAITMPPLNGIWVVIDFTAKGVYLTLMGGESSAEPGLWLLDPDSRRVRKLDGTQFWSEVDSEAAWGVTEDEQSMELRRLDFQTGIVSTRLAVPYHSPLQPGDRQLQLISLNAQGRPLVLERNWEKPYPWQLSILTVPDTLQEVQIPSEWAAGWPMWDNGDPFQSGRELRGLLLSGGIWMSGFYSFPGLAFLATNDTVVRQMTTSPSNIYAIAGGCH